MRDRPLAALRGVARAFAPDFGLGLAAGLGFSPFGLWPVALVAWGGALSRLSQAGTARGAALRGLFFGAGHFALALSWIVQPFFVDPWRHGWMAPFALFLMAFGLALFWALAAWGTHRLRGGPVMLALLLSLAELARGHVLTGFPWALPGQIWIDTPLAQMASLIGTYGMTALMLLALAVPLSFGKRGLVAPVAILALAGGWSFHRLNLPEPAARQGVVRVVQPDIAQSLKWDPDEARRNFSILLDLTEGSGADLVIWPETSVPWLITEGEGAALAIAEAGGAAPVAAGIQRDEGARAWNTLAVFESGGWISQSFDKIHLVPFGEYIPFGDTVYAWTGLRAFASQAGAGYTPGEVRDLLRFGDSLGNAVPLICYEAIFPGELATSPRGDWLLQATNDAWFGTLTGPWQHFAQVRFRAIEQGLPVLRAANTGVSAVIDARGRVASGPDGQPLMLGMGQRGVIDAAIPGALAMPPYARLGDWPLAVLLLAALALAVFTGRRRIRA